MGRQSTPPPPSRAFERSDTAAGSTITRGKQKARMTSKSIILNHGEYKEPTVMAGKTKWDFKNTWLYKFLFGVPVS